MFHIWKIFLHVIWILHICYFRNTYSVVLQDIFTDNVNMVCPPILATTFQNSYVNRIVAYSFSNPISSYQMNGFIRSIDFPPANLQTNSFNPSNGNGFIYGNDRKNGNNTFLISVPRSSYSDIGAFDIIITLAYDLPFGNLNLPVLPINGLYLPGYYARNSDSSSRDWRIYNARYPVGDGFNFIISGSYAVRFDDICIFQVCPNGTQFDNQIDRCTDACYYRNCHSAEHCEVVEGRAVCSCPAYYRLDSDGITCLLDLCALKNCEHICNIVSGKPVCSCPTGMRMNSINMTCVSDPCYNKKCSNICNVVSGNAVCSCPIGYNLQSDGSTCLQDPCYYKRCLNSSVCNLVSGNAVCVCPIGYKLQPDGSTCLQDLCYNKNCYNSNYCNVVSGNAICSCPNGFRLQPDNITCLQDPCYYKRCLAPIYCNVVSDTAMCSCPVGYKLQLDETTCSQVSSLETQNNKTPVIIIAILVPVLVIIVLIFGVAIVFLRRKKAKPKQLMQNPFLQTIENNNIPKTEVIADEWEIFPENFIIDKKIGEGAYGNVFVAKINAKVLSKTMYAYRSRANVPVANEGSTCNVAVKLLKDEASQLEIDDFREEINLMKKIGYHHNIVNMFGCSTVQKPLCLIVEFMDNGDLLQFLRDRRAKLRFPNFNGHPTVSFIYATSYQQSIEKTVKKETSKNSSNDLLSNAIPLDDVEVITPDDLVSFAWQVASGMEFLSKIKLVHRDLAARNILVSANKNVKISDFGLSRKIHYEMQYIGSKIRRMPVKWMSLEALIDQVFTSYSDVWAYGIVLFEIVTLGGTPYPTLSNRELLSFLKADCRMERPENCSTLVYDIMLHCWNKDPLQRPTFTELRQHLEQIISQGGRYFTFDVNEENLYYNVPSFNSIPSESGVDLQQAF